ncbi:MAG TPA: hypothetical protein VLU25_19295 [Acidobacteriota bacterium]|nr:hypothetical protein [Acidobacteriota bacterium]
MKHSTTILFILWAAWATAAAQKEDVPKFYPDDPLLVDNDKLHVDQRPAEIELSSFYDFFSHVFADLGSDAWGEAENVNTLDEVPDSSWFTNRHGMQRMSAQELARGPDRTGGPDPARLWTIFRSKSEGLTPGFQIEDEKGHRYLIKFGAPINPELSTAAEVIATKIFHALGYHVPENYIVNLRPENLRIRPGTALTDRFGDRKELTGKELKRLLEDYPRQADGSMRVLASRYVEGRPVGPFRYFGTRSDDPNDVIDHEQRRELRGLRLFAAWTNHDDSRAHNTLSSYVEEGGKRYLRHYLIDFGSTFGSASVQLQSPANGYHWLLDPELMLTNLKTFGVHVPTYRKVDWPPFPEYSAVGRYEAQVFDCQAWRNEYPNPAFVRLSERDAFWAGKLLMRFTPEELRIIVASGEFSRAYEQEYLLETLIARQRKCGSWALNLVNPLDGFLVEAGKLRFTNLSQYYGFSQAEGYRAQWFVFDNADGSRRQLGDSLSSEETAVSIPRPDFSQMQDPYLGVEIRTLSARHPHHQLPVTVYLRPSGRALQVVGIVRQTTDLIPPMEGNP